MVPIPHLLDQIDGEVASMTADGAYDGQSVYHAVAQRHPTAAVVFRHERRPSQMKRQKLSELDISR
jgi:hypothetical protein